VAVYPASPPDAQRMTLLNPNLPAHPPYDFAPMILPSFATCGFFCGKFGFRVSDLFRVSGFGFRISAFAPMILPFFVSLPSVESVFIGVYL
jgi:hypothetical protein